MKNTQKLRIFAYALPLVALSAMYFSGLPGPIPFFLGFACGAISITLQAFAIIEESRGEK